MGGKGACRDVLPAPDVAPCPVDKSSWNAHSDGAGGWERGNRELVTRGFNGGSRGKGEHGTVRYPHVT